MGQRIQKPEVVQRLAARMQTQEQAAEAWLDAVTETLYEAIKAGECVTRPGLGGFYVRQERESWVFKFNPAPQRTA
jgi:nucleoid DNA-binding protein